MSSHGVKPHHVRHLQQIGSELEHLLYNHPRRRTSTRRKRSKRPKSASHKAKRPRSRVRRSSRRRRRS